MHNRESKAQKSTNHRCEVLSLQTKNKMKMNKTQIIETIRTKSGIEQLNEMQTAMLGCDAKRIILTAPTGSGETIAFTCRMLRTLQLPDGRVQAVVIAPSRELVMQIESVVRPIATGYKTVALYGGHSMMDERNSLTPLPDIIIATPGRLLDHIQRGQIEFDGLQMLVLDEYDKCLQLGFEGEMKRIVKRLGRIDNLVMTSATEIDAIPDYLPTGQVARFDFGGESEPRTRMQVAEVKSFTRDKLDTLTALLQNLPSGERTIVFVNHRESAERVYQRLRRDKIAATLYHGALDQQQRAMAIDLFSNGTAPVLVATDLAARGLDITDVANVIHYHLPVDEAAWTHRNGRTARMNATGTIWVITSEADNIPEYITFDREYQPKQTEKPMTGTMMATIYLNAGKKEKISKGDVAGYIAASGETAPDEIGKIAVHDHHSVVAVPENKVKATVKALSDKKLKGKRVRVSIVEP